MKQILITAAIALAATAAKAQYIVDPDLPVPVATEATDVTPTSYVANWTPAQGEMFVGYYLRNYVKHTAQQDGEKFYYINTDFSYLAEKGGTEEEPVTTVSEKNPFVRGTLKDPFRPDTWVTMNQAYAGEVLCLDGQLNASWCNGQIMLNMCDLTNGGGDVHFKFKAKTDGLCSTLGVYLRIADTEEADNVIEKKIISGLTTEWQEFEFTLHGGQPVSDILIQGEDIGNLVRMFYFIDDLQIWQELKKGETARVLHSEQFVMDNTNANSATVSVTTPFEGDSYAYGVSSYDMYGISVESNIVDVPQVASGIGGVETGEAASPDTPVTVYSLSGAVVARGTAARRPALARGTWVVKTGGKAVKVNVK